MFEALSGAKLRDEGDAPQPLFSMPCRLKQEKEDFRYETQEMTVFSFDNTGKLLKQEYPDGKPIGSVGLQEFEFDGDLKYAFGGGLYLGVGGSGKVTINLTELAPYIKKLFGCDSQN